MIGRLRGILIANQTPEILIECAGVAYEVHVPLSTFYELPALNKEIIVLIHHVVREDAQLLFGFATNVERQLFRMLVKVNGVGPKLALTILSGMNPAQFVGAIMAGDAVALVKMPGVGKKTAERLVIEMKDKVKLLEGDLVIPNLTNDQGQVIAPINQHINDAESALVALGYRLIDASKAIGRINDVESKSVQQLIKEALKALNT